MRITEQEKTQTRAYTNKLLEALDFGEINGDALARELLAWISEDDAKEFATTYEYIEDEETEEDEEEDEDTDENGASYAELLEKYKNYNN